MASAHHGVDGGPAYAKDAGHVLDCEEPLKGRVQREWLLRVHRPVLPSFPASLSTGGEGTVENYRRVIQTPPPEALKGLDGPALDKQWATSPPSRDVFSVHLDKHRRHEMPWPGALGRAHNPRGHGFKSRPRDDICQRRRKGPVIPAAPRFPGISHLLGLPEISARGAKPLRLVCGPRSGA